MKRCIFITGATRGIGYATAVQAAKQGWMLILNGRDEERLVKVKEELAAYGVEVHTLNYDVTDADAIKKAFAWIKKIAGSLMFLLTMLVC